MVYLLYYTTVIEACARVILQYLHLKHNAQQKTYPKHIV